LTTGAGRCDDAVPERRPTGSRDRIRVLFICTGNRALSQMAEAEGTSAERLQVFREIRDDLSGRIDEMISRAGEGA